MRTDPGRFGEAPSVGSIVLSRDCEIIELSDELKSCPGKTVDRTSLFDAMSSDDADFLVKICLDSSDSRDRAILKVHLLDYRYAYVTRNSSPESSVMLFLFKNYRDLIHFGKASVNHIPEYVSVLPISFPELFSKADILDSADAATLLRLITSRFSRSGETVSSHISFNESVSTLSEEDDIGTCVPSGPLALVFTTLLSILDSASADGVLNVNVSRFSGSFEVRMKTVCITNDETFGETSDVLLLSKQLRGAFPRLSLASFAASESEMHLTGSVSPSGEVSFYFGYIPEVFPPLEFKFADPANRADLLSDSVLRLLSLPDFIFE